MSQRYALYCHRMSEQSIQDLSSKTIQNATWNAEFCDPEQVQYRSIMEKILRGMMRMHLSQLRTLGHSLEYCEH
jgi:hypothetical protein